MKIVSVRMNKKFKIQKKAKCENKKDQNDMYKNKLNKLS